MSVSLLQLAKVRSETVYRPEIDGLRAIAILAVIVNHFDSSLLPGGYLGVDVFFVISGCVITASLIREDSKSLTGMMFRFYRRRVKRIQPALVVCVAVVSLLICFFNPSPDQSLWTGLTSVVGASNIYLLDKSTDYFARSSELNPFLHTWSLGVEEQFYFLYPLLVFSVLRFAKPPRALRLLEVAVLALSVVSLLGFLCLYTDNQNFVYYMMPMRAWELGAGCLCHLWLLRRGGGVKDLKDPDGEGKGVLASFEQRGDLLALGMVVGAMLLPSEIGRVATLLAVIGTSFLLVLLREPSMIYRFLCRPIVLHIGLLSYSLYLWHWPIISLSRWTIGLHWWSIPFQVLIIYGLARLSYTWVEKPLRVLSWFRHWRWVCLAPLALVAAVFGVMAGSAKMPGGGLYLGSRRGLASIDESLMAAYRVPGTRFQWNAGRCTMTDPSSRPALSFDQCLIGPDSGLRRKIIVFGDSFVGAFVGGFDDLMTVDRSGVAVVSAWGASPAPGVSSGLVSRKEADRYLWQTVAPKFVASLGPGDWFFLVDDLALLLPRHPTAGSLSRLEQLRRGLLELSAQVQRRGARLAVLHSNPFVRDAHCQPVSAQPQWFNLPGQPPCAFFSRNSSLIRRAPLDRMLRDLERDQKLRVVDLFDHFCPSEFCTYESKKVPLLYRDEWSHPSAAAVRSVAPVIRSALNRPWGVDGR